MIQAVSPMMACSQVVKASHHPLMACQSLRRLCNIAEDFRADGLGGEVGKGVAGLPRFADDFGDEQEEVCESYAYHCKRDEPSDLVCETFGQRGEDGFVNMLAEEADFNDGPCAVRLQARLVVFRQAKALGLRNELFAKR